MSSLFGGSNKGTASAADVAAAYAARGMQPPGTATTKTTTATTNSTADVLASAPTPSGSVPVPDVTPAAEIPTANSAATIAAGNSAASTIAQRAGRQSTVLTKRQPRPKPQVTSTLAGGGGSDYTAKTLG